jgi:hypothetical protein
MTRSRLLLTLVASLGLALPHAACGSDGSSSGAAADGTEAAGYVIVSDADVAAGIAKSEADMTALSTAGTPSDEQIDELFEDWEGYEGTVKDNDPDTYLALEDALGAFKKAAADADQAGMAKAITDFTAASSAYLTAHPGA